MNTFEDKLPTYCLIFYHYCLVESEEYTSGQTVRGVVIGV